jgi:hypothetical protein
VNKKRVRHGPQKIEFLVRYSLLMCFGLLVVGLAVWLLVQRSIVPIVNPAPEISDSSMLSYPDQKLYFQYGNVLLGFTPSNGTTETITRLPDGARMIDVYASEVELSYYYQVKTADSRREVYYVQNDQPAQRDVIVDESVVDLVANANRRLVVYTVRPNFNEQAAPDERRSYTYFVQSGAEPELLHRSKPYDLSGTVPIQDTDKYLYAVTEIAPNGQRALLGLVSCFVCDTALSRPAAIELRLDTRQARLVYASDRGTGRIWYDLDGKSYILEQSTNRDPAPFPENLQYSYSRINAPGGIPELFGLVNSREWGEVAPVRILPSQQLFAVSVRADTYLQDGQLAFDGVYLRTENDATTWQKRDVAGLPANTQRIVSVSSRFVWGCSGVVFEVGQQQRPAALCRTPRGFEARMLPTNTIPEPELVGAY